MVKRPGDITNKQTHKAPAAIPAAVTAPFVVEGVVFLCGAVVMILELVGSRLLAPYFGNSIFVWTSLIGVMLGFMALGNLLGGRLGDRHLSGSVLFWILVGASVSISIIAFAEGIVIPLLSKGSSTRVEAVASAVVLFGLPSAILGMVSPYCIRLRMHAVADSGTTVGSLYALSTLGSIVGTFAAGFWLIAVIGSHAIIMWIAGVPIFLSVLFITPVDLKRACALAAGAVLLVAATLFSRSSVETFDTQYERYMMLRGTDTRTSRPVIALSPSVDGEAESIIYADDGEPLIAGYYFEYFDLALKLSPRVERTLMIGGGAFGFPRYQLLTYPESRADVVEIDPKLVEVSRADFFLKDDPRLRIFTEDGRTYLGRVEGKYDVVMLDAFKSKGSMPYQLTTREAMRHSYDALDDDGILAMNIVASIGGEGSKFVKAEYATVKSVFPRVEIYALRDATALSDRQNLVIIASKDASRDVASSVRRVAPDVASHRVEVRLAPGTRILTDDYAPVDQYLAGF